MQQKSNCEQMNTITQYVVGM